MHLTGRERETLKYLALPRKTIAERMKIKENTVKWFIIQLFNKYAPLDNREKIIIQAIRNGDVKVDEIVLE